MLLVIYEITNVLDILFYKRSAIINWAIAWHRARCRNKKSTPDVVVVNLYHGVFPNLSFLVFFTFNCEG